MTHDESKLEEQIISKVAEIRLFSQFNAAEEIDVDVETDLLKIIQGQADSIKLVGKGLVLQQGIRVQEMELQTDSIDINPSSAVFGQIELQQPVDANTRMVFTEQDINSAFDSEYVRRQMQNIQLNVEGESVQLEMQQMKLYLPDGDKMVFSGKVLLHQAGGNHEFGFNATIHPRTNLKPVLVEGFQCTEGKAVSLEFAVAMLHKIQEILHLPYFELETMTLRITDMEVQTGRIIMQAQAHVRQLPSQ